MSEKDAKGDNKDRNNKRKRVTKVISGHCNNGDKELINDISFLS